MTKMVTQIQHQFITDHSGKPLSVVIPINEYKDLLAIAEKYQDTEEDIHFSAEELESIEISHQEAKENKTISSKDLFQKLRNKYGG